MSYCLRLIEVSQNYRNQGIGSALLGEIIDFCRDQRVQSLHGEAKGEGARLRRWYETRGFNVDSRDAIKLELDEDSGGGRPGRLDRQQR